MSVFVRRVLVRYAAVALYSVAAVAGSNGLFLCVPTDGHSRIELPWNACCGSQDQVDSTAAKRSDFGMQQVPACTDIPVTTSLLGRIPSSVKALGISATPVLPACVADRPVITNPLPMAVSSDFMSDPSASVRCVVLVV